MLKALVEVQTCQPQNKWTHIPFSYGMNGITIQNAHVTYLTTFLAAHIKERPPDWLIHDKWHPTLGSKMLLYRRNLFLHLGQLSSFDFRNSQAFVKVHKGRDAVSCTSEIKEVKQMIVYSQTLMPCEPGVVDEMSEKLKKLNAAFRNGVLAGVVEAPTKPPRSSTAAAATLQEALQLHHGTLSVAQRGSSCAEFCAQSGGVCVERLFPLLNLCSAIKMRVECDSCEESVGADQPAMVESGAATAAMPRGRCLVNQLAAPPPHASKCGGSHPDTRRLCLCFPSSADAASVKV